MYQYMRERAGIYPTLDTNCHTIYWILFTYRIQHYNVLLNPLKIICPLASIISKLAIMYGMFSCSATVFVSGGVMLHLSEPWIILLREAADISFKQVVLRPLWSPTCPSCTTIINPR